MEGAILDTSNATLLSVIASGTLCCSHNIRKTCKKHASPVIMMFSLLLWLSCVSWSKVNALSVRSPVTVEIVTASNAGPQVLGSFVSFSIESAFFPDYAGM
jgi:hypothetical protein